MVPSKAYVNPIRVLELYLRSNSEQASQSLQRFSLALCQRGRFYYSLAIFIDRQSFSFESDNEDDVLGDFFRQPKNRAMLELLQLPLKVIHILNTARKLLNSLLYVCMHLIVC